MCSSEVDFVTRELEHVRDVVGDCSVVASVAYSLARSQTPCVKSLSITPLNVFRLRLSTPEAFSLIGAASLTCSQALDVQQVAATFPNDITLRLNTPHD